MRTSYPKLLFSAALVLFVVVFVVNIGLSQKENPASYPPNPQQAGILDTVKIFLSRLFSRNSITIKVGPRPLKYSFGIDTFQDANLFAPGDKIYMMSSSPVTISSAVLESQETREKYTLSVVPGDILYTAIIPNQTIPGKYRLKLEAEKRSYEIPLEIRSVVTSPRDSLQARQPRSFAIQSPTVARDEIIVRRLTNKICSERCNWEFVLSGNTISDTLVYNSGNKVFRSADGGGTWKEDIIVTSPPMANFDTNVADLPNGDFILVGETHPFLFPEGNAVIARIPSERSTPITTSLINFPSAFDFPKIAVNPFDPSNIYIRGYNVINHIEQAGINKRYIIDSLSVGLLSTDGGLSFSIKDRLKDIISSMIYGIDGKIYTGRYHIYGDGSGHAFSIFEGGTVPIADLPETKITDIPPSPKFSTQSNLTWNVINNDPVLLVDAFSPYRGRIYALWAFPERIIEDANVLPFQRYGYNYDVFLSYSDDLGRTWSPRLKINDDSGHADQFFPSAAIDRAGTVHIAFVDHRNNPTRELFDVYYAYFKEGRFDGRKISSNVRITQSSFGPKNSLSADTLTSFALGDYLKMVAVIDDDSSSAHIAYPCPGTNDSSDPSGLLTTAACLAQVILPKNHMQSPTARLHEISFPNGDRIYTTSEVEKQVLIAQGGQESGNFGSIYLTRLSAIDDFPPLYFPLYRFSIKRTGTHFYGTGFHRATFLSQNNLLRDEGIVGYVTTSGLPEAKVFSMYSPTLDRYVLTHDMILRRTLLARGFRDQFSFYLASGPGSNSLSSGVTPSTPQSSTLSPSQPLLSHTLSLTQGQNFVSSPLIENTPTPLSSLATTCTNLKASRYDNVKKIYTNADTLTGKEGLGYRITTTNNCTITLTGDRQRTASDFTGMQMRTGINLIGAPSSPILFDQIRNNCQTSRAPITVEGNKSKSSTTLNPGRGYLVIVQRDCTLGSPSSSLPPSTQTGAVSSGVGSGGQFLKFFREVMSGEESGQ